MQQAFPTGGAPPHPDDRQALPRVVGAYLVSPRIRACANGWFAGTVAIRHRDRGTDRVLSLTRLFRCAQEALAYAHAEALQWISAAPRIAAAA